MNLNPSKEIILTQLLVFISETSQVNYLQRTVMSGAKIAAELRAHAESLNRVESKHLQNFENKIEMQRKHMINDIERY